MLLLLACSGSHDGVSPAPVEFLEQWSGACDDGSASFSFAFTSVEDTALEAYACTDDFVTCDEEPWTGTTTDGVRSLEGDCSEKGRCGHLNLTIDERTASFDYYVGGSGGGSWSCVGTMARVD
jgi:hypothetical protein